MNHLMALFAYAVLVAFLGFLVIHVPRVDLICIIGLTLVLAGWDLWQHLRGHHI